MGSGDSGCLKMFLIGCGFAVIVAVLATAGGVYLFMAKRAELASFVIEQATNTLIAESGLSEEEQKAMRSQVDRLTEKIRAKELGVDHFEIFANMLMEGPIPGVVLLQGMRQAYLEKKDLLPAEEEEQAKRTIERFQRGLLEGKIPNDRLMEMIDSVEKIQQEETADEPGLGVTREDPSAELNSPRIDRELTVEELRQFLEEAKAVVDEAEIPDEPYEVEIANEFEKIVDLLLVEGKSEAGIPSATGSLDLSLDPLIESATGAVGEIIPATP